LEQARNDPEGLLDDLGSNGAFIDEVQRAPGVFLAIKTVVDRDRRPGLYLVSGSNQPQVSSAVGDSLIGRAAYRTLRPLTLSELRLDETHPGWSFLFDNTDSKVIKELERRAEASGALDWREVAQTGGFPMSVLAQPAQRMTVLNDYVEVFSRRDIREVVGIESSERFESFLRLAAARTAQELNYSGLSNDLGISVNTVRRWVDALSRSYLVELIPPYSRNAGQRVIKAPKLLMVDSAFALAAARETEPSGFHLENLVATDLAVWKDSGPSRGLYHWRLASGQEVDFILEENAQLLPVEVKSATKVTSKETKHLRKFLSDHTNSPRGLIISSDPDIRLLSQRIIAAPWWAVL
jgi:predicted AAA+ superfamily ATPase